MMLNDSNEFDNEPIAPECRATVERIQNALDGTEPLPADGHAEACAACRERVRAARVLLAVLAQPPEPEPVPAEFTARVMNDVWGTWHARRRNRVRQALATVALAASVLIAVAAVIVWRMPKPSKPDPRDMVYLKEPAPRPEPAAEPEKPIRVADAIASTGQAIREAPNPLADSVAVAPKLFDAVTGSFKLPESKADPMGQALEPARKSLDALPVAARAGLEPVTGTAEKAFNRFLRDVGSVKPNS